MGARAERIVKRAISEGRKSLTGIEAKDVCRDYRIPVPKYRLARSEGEAVEFAKEFGFPVVLEVISADILHKTDVGGIYVGLKGPSEVRAHYRMILKNVKRRRPDAKVDGILVREMAPSGIEVIVGGLKDPQFGQTIMFGLGGIFVEVFKDVTFRIAPVPREEAEEMLREIKGYQILRGYRGMARADERALVGIIQRASELMIDFPEISQMDLNPVMAYERGAKVVDAKILL
jgi:acetyl-CoA synthetase (ADP-forming)